MGRRPRRALTLRQTRGWPSQGYARMTRGAGCSPPAGKGGRAGERGQARGCWRGSKQTRKWDGRWGGAAAARSGMHHTPTHLKRDAVRAGGAVHELLSAEAPAAALRRRGRVHRGVCLWGVGTTRIRRGVCCSLGSVTRPPRFTAAGTRALSPAPWLAPAVFSWGSASAPGVQPL